MIDFDKEDVRRFYRLGYSNYAPGGAELPESLKNPLLDSTLREAAEEGFRDAASGKTPRIPIAEGPNKTPPQDAPKPVPPKPDAPKPDPQVAASERPQDPESQNWYRKGLAGEVAQPPKAYAKWYAGGLRDRELNKPSRIAPSSGGGWGMPIVVGLALFGVAALVSARKGKRNGFR